MTEPGQQVACGRLDAAVMGPEDDVIPGGEPVHFAFDREGAGIFEGVGEDRGHLRRHHDAALALVGHERDVMPDVPQQRVHRALS
jgi:hypothetical protein